MVHHGAGVGTKWPPEVASSQHYDSIILVSFWFGLGFSVCFFFSALLWLTLSTNSPLPHPALKMLWLHIFAVLLNPAESDHRMKQNVSLIIDSSCVCRNFSQISTGQKYKPEDLNGEAEYTIFSCAVLHILYKQSKISSSVLYFILKQGEKGEKKGDNANQILKCLPNLLNLTLIYKKETVRWFTYI